MPGLERITTSPGRSAFGLGPLGHRNELERLGRPAAWSMTPAFNWSGHAVGMLANTRADAASGGSGLPDRVQQELLRFGADVHRPDDESMAGRIDDLRAARPSVIVAVGGDGTANAAASVARDVGATLCIVPAGTMDLIARDLGMPTSPRSIVRTLDSMRRRRIDVATVNGRLFLHSSLLGAVPALTSIREAMRSARSTAAWLREAARFAGTAVLVRRQRLSLHHSGGVDERQTRSLAVTCNPLVDGHPASYRRASLDAGVLGVYASRHRGRLAALRLLGSLVAARFQRDSDIACGTCRSLDVDMDVATALVANDGELHALETPLRYRIRSRALRVLVPGPARDDGAS